MTKVTIFVKCAKNHVLLQFTSSVLHSGLTWSLDGQKKKKMAKKKTKTLLKDIAREYASAILLQRSTIEFNEESILDEDEQQYVIDYVHDIAERLCDEPLYDLEEICKRHLEIL